MLGEILHYNVIDTEAPLGRALYRRHYSTGKQRESQLEMAMEDLTNLLRRDAIEDALRVDRELPTAAAADGTAI